jgi:acetyl-CoA acetyltransferase
MYQYGTTPAHLAKIAVAARQWAGLNPKAWVRDPLTIVDVMASPLLADPLRKLDCCLVTDGGGAVVMTRADRARDARKEPVRVIGAGESHVQWLVSQCPDLTLTPGRASGRAAFAVAGITASDADVFQPHDHFTLAVLPYLENLGFCAKGEAGNFVADGRLRPGGALPGMTSGGRLSYCHPGALGILLLVEAVRGRWRLTPMRRGWPGWRGIAPARSRLPPMRATRRRRHGPSPWRAVPMCWSTTWGSRGRRRTPRTSPWTTGRPACAST